MEGLLLTGHKQDGKIFQKKLAFKQKDIFLNQGTKSVVIASWELYLHFPLFSVYEAASDLFVAVVGDTKC